VSHSHPILQLAYNSNIIEFVNPRMDKVKVFRALGDETRLAMVKKLRDAGGEMPCSALVHACETTPTAATYHYKELEQAGLITRRREGQSVTVVLNLKGLAREFAALLRCL
jgi:DNA-binding transcriptional ArsR family regulator